MKKANYLWHAFKSKFNLAYLGLGALAGLFLPAIPFFWGGYLAVEALILTLFSTNKKFKLMADGKEAREEEAFQIQRQRNAIRIAGQTSRNRLREFDQKVRKIRQNYRQKASSSGTENMIENSLATIERLEVEYVRYLHSYVRLAELQKKDTDTAALTARLNGLKEKIAASEGPVKEILQKQAEILEKRINNKSLNTESEGVLEAQLTTIEETMNYLLDDSVKVYDKNVTDHVDNVLINMETTKETLREIESFVEFSDPISFSEKVR